MSLTDLIWMIYLSQTGLQKLWQSMNPKFCWRSPGTVNESCYMYVASNNSEALKGSGSIDSIKSLETFTFAIGCTCKTVIYSGDEK